MKIQKNVGVWMDHSTANLIDLSSEKNSRTIASAFTPTVEGAALQRGEKRMHQKEQQLQAAYYKEIADAILAYDHVLLFGPTDAKTELFNDLSKDVHFKDIRIDLEPADKMTDHEKVAFVKSHFE